VSTTVQQRSPNRWILPVILLIILAVIVLAVIFGPRLMKAASAHPTATPLVITATPGPTSVTTVVVTATPGAATATANPTVGGKTPTSGGHGTRVKGGVTPLPGVAITPVPGLVLGMITHPVAVVHTVQAGATAGSKKYAFYLHPLQVVKRDLPAYGFRPPIDVISPPRPYPASIPRRDRQAVVLYQKHPYFVFLAQPATQGAKGIWMIVTIRPPATLRTGTIARPATIVARTQHLANTNAKYHYYFNPTRVATTDLPDYGFEPQYITLVAPAKPVSSTTARPLRLVVIRYLGTTYDVYVAQPGVRGVKGIWMIVTIRPV